MRVGPYMQPNMNMPKPNNQNQRNMQNRPQNRQQNPEPARSPAMAMTQKILSEQGEVQAGHFLYAIRPYVAPAELAFIEQRLNIQSKRDPNMDQRPTEPGGSKPAGGMNMQMIQMLMGLMNSNSKPDPMSLIKMMNGAGRSN